MNQFKIKAFTCGQLVIRIVNASNINEAILSSGIPVYDIIEVSIVAIS